VIEIVQIRPAVARFADQRQQPVRADAARQDVVLDLARHAALAAAVAVGDDDFPVVLEHRLKRDAIAVRRQGGSVDAQRRLYRLRLEPLEEIDEWLAPYRRLWGSRLNALERHLDETEDR